MSNELIPEKTSPKRVFEVIEDPFSPGADLWIVTHNSPWLRSVDWLLNFQIFRSFNRDLLKTPKQVQLLAEAHEISLEGFHSLKTEPPILIAARSHLPARAVVYFPKPMEKLNAWIELIASLGQNLKMYRIRVFADRESLLEDSDIAKIEKLVTSKGVNLQWVANQRK